MNIQPYADNAKKHPEKQVQLIANSIKRFGWQQPIVVDKNGIIIVGHGRYTAWQNHPEGMDEPWITDNEGNTLSGKQGRELTAKEVKAYRLADNKLNESDWDLELAIEELKDIDDPALQELTGFDMDLLLEPEEADDAVPETPEESRSKLEDLYQLGPHRVLCGDSTKVEDVEKLMDGQKADMVFTSPPYNANTKAGDGDIFTSKTSKKLYADGYSDNLPPDEYVKFAQTVLGHCFSFTEGFIFWNVSYNKNSRYQYIQQITPFLEYLREQICWKKSSTIPFKGSLMRDWEPIYLFSTIKANLGLDKVTSNFWEVSNTHSQQENHKACFPVELVVKGIELIENSKILFDPFLGSGSTLIAAQKTGRHCYGLELDPKYVDVIVQRYVDYVDNPTVILNNEDVTHLWTKTPQKTPQG